MMETTDFRDRDDWPGGYPSDPVIWCVLLEAKVRSAPMIVPSVGREDVSKVRFVDDDDVIETLSSDRADQAFDVRILPRTRRRSDDVDDTHARESALEDIAVDAVSISVQPARRRVLGKCVDHLLGGPLGCRMICDVHMYDAPAEVREHDQDEQHPAGERWHREEVDRHGSCEVIREERPPRLRRRLWVSFQ
jgi:hypothetical protein